MNILFLTISTAINDINNHGIYPDLLRYFANQQHDIYIVCPFERKYRKKTGLTVFKNVNILGVKTLNLTKTNIFEKGIGILYINYQYLKAIKTYFKDIKFDLILYSTPPITFNLAIHYFKKKYKSKSYLLLKDIFPQNAVDLGALSKNNPLYWFFRIKEKKLYELSDYIGCMSPANVDFILKHNPYISDKIVEVCPNSIEIQHYKKLFDRESLMLKYQIPKNKTIFTFGGNLGKPQGIDFLIEVLQSNLHNSAVFFLISGSGTEYKKLNKWFIMEKPQNVMLMQAIPKDDYDDLLQLCDVGLIFLNHCFTIPNYPSRLLSYMENKMPVLMATDVNTDIGPIAEKNGYGFWVKSGDLNSFNNKLQTLIMNPELRIDMGEKAYQFLLKEYTVDISYNIIMKHFKKN